MSARPSSTTPGQEHWLPACRGPHRKEAQLTTNRHPLRLMETFRSVFYTPIYVSISGGFLEKAGLDVTFSTSPPEFAHPLSALNQGAADIVQSGIMRSIIASDWGAETVPAHIAKINARDGFFVLSRRPWEEFRWPNLRRATVIPVGFRPCPGHRSGMLCNATRWTRRS